MPDLYLQGLLLQVSILGIYKWVEFDLFLQDIEESKIKLELAVLESTLPTTLVDVTRLIVRKTPLYHGYNHLRSQFRALNSSKLEEKLLAFTNDNSASINLNDWSKRQSVFERTESIAPMVQTLLDETRRIPPRLREAYMRQWRRSLSKKALAMIKFVEDET